MKNLKLLFIEDGLSIAEMNSIVGGVAEKCPSLKWCDQYTTTPACTALLHCGQLNGVIINPSGGGTGGGTAQADLGVA